MEVNGINQKGVADLLIKKLNHKSPHAPRVTYYVRTFCAKWCVRTVRK